MQNFMEPSVFNHQVHMYPSVRLTRTHLSGSYVATRWGHRHPPVGFICGHLSSSYKGLRQAHMPTTLWAYVRATLQDQMCGTQWVF